MKADKAAALLLEELLERGHIASHYENHYEF